jgi:RNA polymerase sigma-70 factor, ECF subfamily
MNAPDDAQLLQRCRSGDLQAIETLVERYQRSVFRLALSILGDPAEAEESAQDSFVAALGALDSYRGKAAFKTWLFAIAINHCRSRLRQRKRRERLGKLLNRLFRVVDLSHDNLERQVIHTEREREVRLAVGALDEKGRLPVILRYYHELSIAEIAQVFGVSERTVHNRLRAAHQALTARLDGFER